MDQKEIVAEIREFNCFYADILGLLDKHILDSGYSLTEARVIIEINKRCRCTANDICTALSIDRSYMSRIIRKFEKEDLIDRHTSESDGRNIELWLTEKGLKIFNEIEVRSNKKISELIEKLNVTNCFQNRLMKFTLRQEKLQKILSVKWEVKLLL